MRGRTPIKALTPEISWVEEASRKSRHLALPPAWHAHPEARRYWPHSRRWFPGGRVGWLREIHALATGSDDSRFDVEWESHDQLKRAPGLVLQDAARSVTTDVAISVHAAMAGDRVWRYSRRRRKAMSAARFPACGAGRRVAGTSAPPDDCPGF